MNSEDAAVDRTGRSTSPGDSSHPSATHRSIRPWHVAGVLLVATALTLGIYAFWPQLTGAADADDEENDPGAERVEMRARVDVMIAEPTDFILLAEATGHLSPWRSADISAEASGLVEERLVEEGSRVSAGDVLLRLDDRDEQIALEEARSRLLEAQIQYADIRIGSANATGPDSARIEEAERTFARAEQAFEDGSITLEEMQVARREYDATVLRSGARRPEVEAVRSGLEQAEQAVERAELQLSRKTVRAPFGGRVADLAVEMGQRISAGTMVMRLLDDARMKVTVDVLEADLVGLEVSGAAHVRIPAMADTTVSGRIFSINPSVDPQTGTGRVTVELSNPRGDLLSGLFTYVRLETGRLPGRIVVPADAVLVRQGRDLVFLVEGERARWTYVSVGRRSGDLIEITEPIAPGDSVAVAGHHALSHDARIEVGEVVPLADLTP